MEYREAAALLLRQNDILILTHKRPDGDTIGCAVGLCQALREQGKRAWVLPNEDATTLFTPYLEGYLAQEYFAKETCLDAGRAACGELVYDLIRVWGPVSREAALPLYVAVSTDTGCFQYSNTTAATHRVAADLMDTGIDAQGANKRHFRTKSLKRLKLESLIVDTMDLHDGGAIAIAAVSLADMARLEATERDAEDIAAFVGQVEGVHTSVTIRELAGGACKLSVRTDATLNATKVCALLGGGGHAAAAGCTVPGTVEEAKAAIMDAIRKVQADA